MRLVAFTAGFFAVAVCGRAEAQVRVITDIELFTPHWEAEGNTRNAVFTAVAAAGFPVGEVVMPYVGGGLGILTAQARLGIWLLPGGLQTASFVARFETRPQLVVIPCAEPAIFGNVGLGYRWRATSAPVPSPMLYVLPAFDAGPAWVKVGCGNADVPDEPASARMFYGGSVGLGMDF